MLKLVSKAIWLWNFVTSDIIHIIIACSVIIIFCIVLIWSCCCCCRRCNKQKENDKHLQHLSSERNNNSNKIGKIAIDKHVAARIEVNENTPTPNLDKPVQGIEVKSTSNIYLSPSGIEMVHIENESPDVSKHESNSNIAGDILDANENEMDSAIKRNSSLRENVNSNSIGMKQNDSESNNNNNNSVKIGLKNYTERIESNNGRRYTESYSFTDKKVEKKNEKEKENMANKDESKVKDIAVSSQVKRATIMEVNENYTVKATNRNDMVAIGAIKVEADNNNSKNDENHQIESNVATISNILNIPQNIGSDPNNMANNEKIENTQNSVNETKPNDINKLNNNIDKTNDNNDSNNNNKNNSLLATEVIKVENKNQTETLRTSNNFSNNETGVVNNNFRSATAAEIEAFRKSVLKQQNEPTNNATTSNIGNNTNERENKSGAVSSSKGVTFDETKNILSENEESTTAEMMYQSMYNTTGNDIECEFDSRKI